ncbi:alpha/beta hydrolase [Micromonospora sp. CA-248089]|uniref:Secreted peptidase n=1 Tax=Micromonospora echinospora TaxID=1877 RepID=A0A2C9DJS2_MICEC|nr:secreted peptidase [Micromonospora echinospora]
MRKLLAGAAAVALGLTAQVTVVPSAAAARPADRPIAGIAWSPCPDDDPLMDDYLVGLECGSLEVPLDHSRPNGQKITLALTRAKHTSPESQYQGVVLLNRGQWPGTIGRDLPTRFADGSTGLLTSVGSTYDWIGFDPRGVGASEPSISCDPTYLYPGGARPDYVPAGNAEEAVWVNRARTFAESCGQKYGDTLKYFRTADTARDMDLMRIALGQEKINYLGYSHGTYVGSVYASLFPNRVRRMVLDSVVRPSSVGYKSLLETNEAFEKRAQIYFAWIAEHDSYYHLGRTPAQVEANYYKGMAMLRKAPIDGKIGPAEYSDIFSVNVYRSYIWTYHAGVLADWVLRGDPSGLRDNFLEPDFPAQNTHAMYRAVQCVDGPWPRNWNQWRTDLSQQHRRGNKFMTWNNGWYNAPCAFWPVPAGKPTKVGDRNVNMLLIQAEHDALTPVQGAVEVHRLFPNSRLVLERGGVFHGASLTANANACLNNHVIAYLRDGTRPNSVAGVDAHCNANPLPDPADG